jgi:hypothetical protein
VSRKSSWITKRHASSSYNFYFIAVMFEASVTAYSRILGSSLYRTYASVGRVQDTLHVSVRLIVST